MEPIAIRNGSRTTRQVRDGFCCCAKRAHVLLAAWAMSLAVLLLAPIDYAAAFAVDSLYKAQTIVTGQGEESRGQGFTTCLEQVLVKVSGDPRLMDDPRAAAIASNAAELVKRFHYRDRMAGIPVHDEQGTRDRPHDLIVEFDPAGVDAALRSLGREPWSPRPSVVFLLNVRNGAVAYTLASDGRQGRDMREALSAASRQFGLPLVLPISDALAELGEAAAWAETKAPELGRRVQAMGGDVALLGTLVWNDEALGWEADWRLVKGSATYAWTVSGVSFDAAFRSALSGASQILSGNGRPR